MIEPERFRQAVVIVKEAYDTDEEFRKATIASALSAINELQGSHTDEEVAAVVVDRLFGDS